MASADTVLDTAREDAWRRLRRQLELADAFWLGFVFAGSRETLDVLAARTANVLRRHARQVARLSFNSPDELAEGASELLKLVDDAPSDSLGCIWLQGTQFDAAWHDAWGRLLLGLNQIRDPLRARVPGGLVLAGPRALREWLPEIAPDLWSVRSMVLDIVPTPSTRRQLPQSRADAGIDDLSPLPSLESFAGEDASDVAALLRDAERLRRQGRLADAIARSREAVEAAAMLGEAQEALALAALADSEAADEDFAAAWEHTHRASQLAAGVDPAFAMSLDLRAGQFARENGDFGIAVDAYASAVARGRDVLAHEPSDVSLIQRLANALVHFGDTASDRSDHEAARTAFEEALALFVELGDAQGEAASIRGLGEVAEAQSEYDAAHEAFERALSIYQRISDVLGEATCVACLGDVALGRSEYDTARAAYERALPLYQQIGNILGEANCIWDLGVIALREFDASAALTAFTRALPLYQQIGNLSGQANCIFALGDVALRRGDLESASAAFTRAMPLYRQLGDVLGEANCTRSSGDIALARSEPDAARAAYEQALLLYQRSGDVLGGANCLGRLAQIAVDRGDRDTARAAADRAMALYQRIGNFRGEAICITTLAGIALDANDHDSARAAYAEALSRYEQIGDVAGEVISIRGLADVALGCADDVAVRRATKLALDAGDRLTEYSDPSPDALRTLATTLRELGEASGDESVVSKADLLDELRHALSVT